MVIDFYLNLHYISCHIDINFTSQVSNQDLNHLEMCMYRCFDEDSIE